MRNDFFAKFLPFSIYIFFQFHLFSFQSYSPYEMVARYFLEGYNSMFSVAISDDNTIAALYEVGY